MILIFQKISPAAHRDLRIFENIAYNLISQICIVIKYFALFVLQSITQSGIDMSQWAGEAFVQIDDPVCFPYHYSN